MFVRGIYLFLLASILAACDNQRQEHNTHAYACYGDTPARYMELVFKLDPRAPRLVNLYGGRRLVTAMDADGAHAVYKRDESWNTAQFFDVLEFDRRRLRLTHSYVYFMNDAEYQQGYGAGDTRAYSFKEQYYNPRLFALIPEAPEAGHTVRLGWNKTHWDCQQIPSILFLPYQLLAFFHAVLRV